MMSPHFLSLLQVDIKSYKPAAGMANGSPASNKKRNAPKPPASSEKKKRLAPAPPNPFGEDEDYYEKVLLDLVHFI